MDREECVSWELRSIKKRVREDVDTPAVVPVGGGVDSSFTGTEWYAEELFSTLSAHVTEDYELVVKFVA